MIRSSLSALRLRRHGARAPAVLPVPPSRAACALVVAIAAGAGLTSGLSSGCAPAAPGVAAHSAILPLTGPCPADATAGTEFTTEAQSLRLTVTAADMAAPVAAEGGLGGLSIDTVPVGVGRVVGLFGLVGGKPTWRGVVRNVSLERDEVKELDVLMARVADLTCSRGTDSDKRAFHTATVLADGSVLVMGGAKESTDASATCFDGCRRLTATASAAIYDPTTGSFTPVGSLARARMFHTATLLEDGRVVVAGGAGGALVHPAGDSANPFPIEPLDPIADVEVFDPATRRFTTGGADPGGPRVFAAAALLDGEVIVTGGIPAAGDPRHDLGNALDTTTICGGSPLACRAGPRMAARRAGHVAFAIEPDGVFVWGGSIDVDSAGGVPRFQLEVLRGAAASFQLLNVAQMFANRNLFFAAAAQYVDFRMLLAGGLVRRPDGSFELSTIEVEGQGPQGAVYIYDASFDVAGGIAVGPTDGLPMHLQAPRFFGSAASLPGGTRAVIAGGYTDLDFSPSDDLEQFDQDDLAVVPLLVGGQARTLREPRGGLVATANGDGTVVFFGGEAPLDAGRAPVATAEIFADPLTPPEVAE